MHFLDPDGSLHHIIGQSTNKLLREGDKWETTIIGGKTGFSQLAGGCLLIVLKDKNTGRVIKNVNVQEKLVKGTYVIDVIANVEESENGHFDKYSLDENKFNDYLFTNDNNKIYSHTEDYTKLIRIFLLSGKYEGYPLHLIIFGQASNGKTTGLECINKLFQEGIFEAGNSTLKGLIPAYRETPAKTGYILYWIRVGLIDELFKMIEGAENGKYLEYLTNYFSKLNMLLEHKERIIGSGTVSIKAKATAKLLIMTNPYRKRKLIHDHVGIIDITTLSRFIPLVQNKEEIEHIKKKDIVINNNKLMSKEEFLTIFDSCQAFISGYNEDKVKEIYYKTLKEIKGSMHQVWEARGLHHAVLLLDGIVKARCLFNDDISFIATAEDYAELEKIINYITKSWDCNLQDWDIYEGF